MYLLISGIIFPPTGSLLLGGRLYILRIVYHPRYKNEGTERYSRLEPSQAPRKPFADVLLLTFHSSLCHKLLLL